MARPCSVCVSRHREEIERRLKANEPLRSVSAWLKEQNESISKDTLSLHGRSHLALQSEIGKQMAAVVALPVSPPPALSLVPPPSPSSPLLSPMETLAKVQEVSLAIVDKLSSRLLAKIGTFDEEGLLGDLNQTQATLLIAAMKEARTVAKTRHEMVHGKKILVGSAPETHPVLKGMTNDELAKKREELRRKQGGG